MAEPKKRKPFLLRFMAGTLLVVALFGVIAFAAMQLLTLNSFKPRIEAYASQAIGLPAKINGDITASLQRGRPALVLNDVIVGEKGRGSIYATDKITATMPFGRPAAGEPWKVFVSIRNLKVDGEGYGDYKSPLHYYYPDGVELPDIEGSLKDARMDGSASLRNDQLRLDVKLAGLDYARFAKGVSGGNARIDLHLKADARHLMPSLNGTAFLTGDKGVMQGNAIDLWAGSMLSNILKGSQKETEINCSVADFRIANGIARSKAIIVDTPRVSVSGKGSVDLVHERVDMRFTPQPKSATLLSLATPVNVSGPFDHIETTPDPTGIVTKMGTLVLGVFAAPAALIPLVSTGSGNGNPCAEYLKAREGK